MVENSRQHLRESINLLVQANLAVRSQLVDNERLLAEALAQIDAGVAVEDILSAMPTVEERTANIEAVQKFYARRSDVRAAAIRAALDEGTNVSELAEAFGLPHETIVSHAVEAASEVDHR